MSPATAPETETVWLVNISPEKWPPRNRTYFGSLEIRSPEAGEAYAVRAVRGCKRFIDMGDRRTIDSRLTAREVARILREKLTAILGKEVFTAYSSRKKRRRAMGNSRTRDGNCRNFSAGWRRTRTWNGSEARIPCLLPIWSAARRGNCGTKSPGFTMQNRSRNVRFAGKE